MSVIWQHLRTLAFRWLAICLALCFLCTGFLTEALTKTSAEQPRLSKGFASAKTAKKKRAKVHKIAHMKKVRASSAGNAYDWGNCTWYAKGRRPDLPNNLGNADTWFAEAQAQGIPTGYEPKAGAIGQNGMHVVYIEKVKPNGKVVISEMNYAGLGVVSRRILAADTFVYIY